MSAVILAASVMTGAMKTSRSDSETPKRLGDCVSAAAADADTLSDGRFDSSPGSHAADPFRAADDDADISDDCACISTQ
jgi:hypothetical protein